MWLLDLILDLLSIAPTRREVEESHTSGKAKVYIAISIVFMFVIILIALATCTSARCR